MSHLKRLSSTIHFTTVVFEKFLKETDVCKQKQENKIKK